MIFFTDFPGQVCQTIDSFAANITAVLAFIRYRCRGLPVANGNEQGLFTLCAGSQVNRNRWYQQHPAVDNFRQQPCFGVFAG